MMKVFIEGLENEVLEAEIRSKALHINIAREHTDDDDPNPLEIFLTSLCACISVYTKRYLREFSQYLKDVKVEVCSELSKSTPYRFESILVRILLPFDIDDRKDSFVRFIKNCPIHNTLEKSVKIDFEVASNQ